MEGGSSGASCLMNFGDHSIMMPPPVAMNTNDCSTTNNTTTTITTTATTTTTHDNNTLFFPHPQQHQIGHPSIGCYFMDGSGTSSNTTTTNSSSNSVKAKIMSHPHYRRLLSAYVNCQKVFPLQLFIYLYPLLSIVLFSDLKDPHKFTYARHLSFVLRPKALLWPP